MPENAHEILAEIRTLRKETSEGFDALHTRVTGITNECAARKVVVDAHDEDIKDMRGTLKKLLIIITALVVGTPAGVKLLELWIQ